MVRRRPEGARQDGDMVFVWRGVDPPGAGLAPAAIDSGRRQRPSIGRRRAAVRPRTASVSGPSNECQRTRGLVATPPRSWRTVRPRYGRSMFVASTSFATSLRGADLMARVDAGASFHVRAGRQGRVAGPLETCLRTISIMKRRSSGLTTPPGHPSDRRASARWTRRPGHRGRSCLSRMLDGPSASCDAKVGSGVRTGHSRHRVGVKSHSQAHHVAALRLATTLVKRGASPAASSGKTRLRR